MATKASEIGIQIPCTLDWTKMTPAQGGRFCGDCKKVVRDLSNMTEAAARALVEKERYAGLCVRMLVDRDGNVFYGGDKLVSASLLGKAKRAAVAAAAIALPLATNGCSALGEPLGFGDQEQTDDDHLEPMMCGVAINVDDDPAIEVDAGADAPDADADADADGDGDAAADADADADAGNDPQTDGGTDAAPDVIIYK
jgi:hypothetical protein